MEARGLKQARTDMKGEVDELKAQLAKYKNDALTWKFAASARDKAKRDKERWKDIKDKQNAPAVVVMDKWEVERDGLGKVVQPATTVALEKELNALKKRIRDDGAVRDELKATKKERNQLKQRLVLAERQAKQYGADARRLQDRQTKKSVGSMGSAPGSSGKAAGGKKAKQQKNQQQQEGADQSRAESPPLGSDEETRAVQEATIEGLSVELERTIVEQEEIRVQLERTQLERMRAQAQRDEAIQALELAHSQSEQLAAQVAKLQGKEPPTATATAAAGTSTAAVDPAQMAELGEDAVAAAAAVAESLISVPSDDVEAVEAAAIKIQAGERGRVARANSPTKAAAEVAGEGAEADDEQFVSTDPAAEAAAATKIQAVHRGKTVRGKAAQSETAADGDEAEPQPEPAAEEPAVEVEPAAEPEAEAEPA